MLVTLFTIAIVTLIVVCIWSDKLCCCLKSQVRSCKRGTVNKIKELCRKCKERSVKDRVNKKLKKEKKAKSTKK